jgi:signal transduction histidine kinase
MLHETKNGDIIPVEISHHIFELGDKKVVFCIARDITERKKTEEKLKSIIRENEDLLRQAIENEKVKTEFFCNISHEFKTPLNIILGVIQLIECTKNIVPEYMQIGNYYRYISILKQNCFRILRLVNNLLEINKIDANYMEMTMENHNIVSLVENITLSVAEYVNNKGLTLVFDTSVEEKIIACDTYKIERIILNLLSNSIKYSKSDTGIYVNIQDNDDNVLISVRDSGIGIPKEKLGTIFNRFTQVDSSLTRKCEGSGIGLSIVKPYVEMHGGKIWVESEYGIETKFFIQLPARILPDDDKHKSDSHRGSSSSISERINIEFSDIYSN